MGTFSWDREAISSIISELTGEKEKLEQEMQLLDKNKKEIAAAFEGEAAEQFLVNINADIQNIKTLNQMIGQQVERLKNVRDNHYGTCEKTLHNEVERLCAEIV